MKLLFLSLVLIFLSGTEINGDHVQNGSLYTCNLPGNKTMQIKYKMVAKWYLLTGGVRTRLLSKNTPDYEIYGDFSENFLLKPDTFVSPRSSVECQVEFRTNHERIEVRTSEKSGNKTYFRCKIDLRDDRTGEPRYSDYGWKPVWYAKKVPCEKDYGFYCGKTLHRSHYVRQGFLAKDKFEDYDGKFGYTTLEAPDEGLEKLKKINYTKIRCGMAFNRGGDGDWTMGARFDGEFNLLTDDVKEAPNRNFEVLLPKGDYKIKWYVNGILIDLFNNHNWVQTITKIGDMFKYVLKMTPWVLDIIGKVKVTSVFTYEEPFNFTHIQRVEFDSNRDEMKFRCVFTNYTSDQSVVWKINEIEIVDDANFEIKTSVSNQLNYLYTEMQIKHPLIVEGYYHPQCMLKSDIRPTKEHTFLYVNGGKYTGLQDFDFHYFFLQTNEKRVQELCNQWRGLLAIKRLPQLYNSGVLHSCAFNAFEFTDKTESLRGSIKQSRAQFQFTDNTRTKYTALLRVEKTFNWHKETADYDVTVDSGDRNYDVTVNADEAYEHYTAQIDVFPKFWQQKTKGMPRKISLEYKTESTFVPDTPIITSATLVEGKDPLNENEPSRCVIELEDQYTENFDKYFDTEFEIVTDVNPRIPDDEENTVRYCRGKELDFCTTKWSKCYVHTIGDHEELSCQCYRGTYGDKCHKVADDLQSIQYFDRLRKGITVTKISEYKYEISLDYIARDFLVRAIHKSHNTQEKTKQSQTAICRLEGKLVEAEKFFKDIL